MDYPTLLHLEHEHLAGRCDLQTVLDQSNAYLAGRDDLEVRQIVAGKNASIFDLIRPLYVTAGLGGEAHTLAGWVLALDGSPARGMVLVDGLRGAGGIRWRYGRSKRLSARQVDIILAYIRSLPDYDKPGYYVDLCYLLIWVLFF